MATKNKYLKAYTQHKSNAKGRGIEFLLTFEQWRDWWIATGKWDLRGRGRGKYCMRRHGDIGPYSIDNIFCGTNEDNVRDGNIGKIDSQETRSKKSKALKGKAKPWFYGELNPMHRPEVKAKISMAVGGSNNYRAKTVVTPFGIFGSTSEAAKMLNIPAVTVQWRCRNNKAGWSYLAIA